MPDETDPKPRWWARRGRKKPHRTLKMPPGTLMHDPEAPKPVLTAFGYSPDGFVEQCLKSAMDVPELLRHWPTVWVNVDGLGDANVVAEVGELFGIHRLALEDVLHVTQRPKVEAYPDHLYIVARMPELDGGGRLRSDQLSLFVGRGWVLTFQERAGDCFDNIRDRIRHRRGRVRDARSDYLAYALLDSLTDSYFPILERIGEQLEDLEDEIVQSASRSLIARVHEIKRDLIVVRRAIWPQREALNALVRDQNALILDETRIYLRDLYDHTIQLIDLTETHREVCADLMDLHLSSQSNRMNEVMKFLTMISTIFIPLSFIAGIYGMNFDTRVSRFNMPELEWAWGYPFSLGMMAVVAIGLVFYFRSKRWL